MVLDVEAILNRWEPIARAAGFGATYWREQYEIQLRQLPQYLVQRIAEIQPIPDSAQVSYRQFMQGFVNAYANVVSNPRPEDKTRLKLGSSTKDQVFYPIAPCRIVDTRNSGGPIVAGTARNFYFYGSNTASYSWSSQGGAAGTSVSACPQTVITNLGGSLGFSPVLSAALATVTVVNATAAGNWLIWGGAGAPAGVTSSALNWSAGQVLANTTLLPWGGRTGTGLGGTVIDFAVKYNGPSGRADVVVDVVGYFMENQATALDCQYLVSSGTGGTVPNGGGVAVSFPSCGAGYTKTGTGCSHQTIGIQLSIMSPSSLNQCQWLNNSGTTVTAALFHAETVCCRIPGTP